MVEILIIVQLVLLSLAIIVLFAMMGQVSRGTPSSPSSRPGSVVNLDVPLGERALGLPPTFAGGAGLVLVFSTSCAACGELAPKASAFASAGDLPVLGVLVSSASESAGGEFVGQHELRGLPVHIDLGGELARNALGVSSSPAVVALTGDREIVSAVAFSSFEALAPWLESIAGHRERVVTAEKA